MSHATTMATNDAILIAIADEAFLVFSREPGAEASAEIAAIDSRIALSGRYY